jgi:helix-turn-helix protein
MDREDHAAWAFRAMEQADEAGSVGGSPMTTQTLDEQRTGQADRLLRLLEYAAELGTYVPLPAIMALGIASYTRRISDLRQRGFRIECERERTDSGQLRTRYRLVRQ